MATTTPPRPPAAPPPPPGPPEPPRRPAVPARERYGRPLAVTALVVVVLAVLFLVFGRSGGATYKLEFAEGDQLVKGNQVQVGGVPVGSVTNIVLDARLQSDRHDPRRILGDAAARRHDGAGEGPFALQRREPLRRAEPRRRTTRRRSPRARLLPASATKRSDRPRPAVQHVQPEDAQGPAAVHPGHRPNSTSARASRSPASTEYFAPSLSATDHFFAELVRDQSTFTNFLVETAKAVTTIGARKEQLSGLIGNANTTFQAIGAEQSNLAQGLKELPITLRQGNETFAELPVDVQRADTSSSTRPSRRSSRSTSCSPGCDPLLHDGDAGRARTSATRSAGPGPTTT